MCCFPDVDTADKPPRACLDSEMVGNTQDKLLKLILGVLEVVGRAEKLVCDLFPDMECWKQLEPPTASRGHPIREAEPLWAPSRTTAWLAPGNGLAEWLSAQSQAGGNTTYNLKMQQTVVYY